MKRGLAAAAAIFLAFPAFAREVIQAQATAADSARHAVPAANFINAVRASEFTRASAMVSPAAPAGTFTPQRIQELWRALGAQVGALGTFKLSKIQTIDSMHAVDFDATFERANLTMRVVMDNKAQVRGFGFLAAAAPGVTASSLPPYADTSRFSQDTLTFGVEQFKLKGTLSKPRVAAGARVPAVILVHGSGPNDRDETIGPNKPFRDVAYGLSSRGIAVFRYDKRTFLHASRLDSLPITVESEVIEDALQAIKAVRANPSVDTNRIYLIGHSLGGMLAPEISKRSGDLAGIILLAAPARRFADVLKEQLTYLESLARATGDTANTTLRRARAQLDSLGTRKVHDTTTVIGVPASYWYHLDSLDALSAVRQQKARVLVIQGGARLSGDDGRLPALAGRPGRDGERHLSRLPHSQPHFSSRFGQSNANRISIAARIRGPRSYRRNCRLDWSKVETE